LALPSEALALVQSVPMSQSVPMALSSVMQLAQMCWRRCLEALASAIQIHRMR